MDDFVFNDEAQENSHGFVLLNGGGRFERFRANPVMLLQHDPGKVIGAWKDLRQDGGRLIATPIYDEEDPEALACKRKVEKNFLKGCSPGIIINAIEVRTTPDGREQLTVTDWTLCEGSIVSIPSNAGALKLYNQQGEAIPDNEVKLSINELLKTNTKKMEVIQLSVAALTALGLSNGADSTAISAAITALSAAKETAEKEVEKYKKEKVDNLVDLAIKEGRITADAKADFTALATANFDLAKRTIAAIPAREMLSGKITNTSAGGVGIPSDREKWTYLEWAKKDPAGLQKLKVDNPTAFEELKKRIK